MNARFVAWALTMSAALPLTAQIHREVVTTMTNGSDVDPEIRARTVRRELIRRYQPVFTELGLPPKQLEALKLLLLRREKMKWGPKTQDSTDVAREIQDLLGDAFERWTDGCRTADIRSRWVREFVLALEAADAPALSAEEDSALVDQIREVLDFPPPDGIDREVWRRNEMAQRAAVVLDAKQAAVFGTFLQFLADRTQVNVARAGRAAALDPSRATAVRHYQTRLDIQRSYGDFFREENLPPAQGEALRDFLVAEREPLVAFAEAALKTQPHEKIQQEIDVPVRDEKRRRVLGDSLRSALLAFESTQMARRKAEWLAVDCIDRACPLEPAQQRAIVAIIKRHPPSSIPANPDASGALSDFEQAQLDEARDVLTADQQRVFTTFLTDDHADRDRLRAKTTRK